ncbi:MAG: hypothetical protein P8Y70_18715 [Candidatus Lokiarchaeota archaeon]
MKVTKLERELEQVRSSYDEQLRDKEAQITKIKEDHKAKILVKEREFSELQGELNSLKEENEKLHDQMESLDFKEAEVSISSLVLSKMKEKMQLQGFVSEKELESLMNEAKEEIKE